MSKIEEKSDFEIGMTGQIVIIRPNSTNVVLESENIVYEEDGYFVSSTIDFMEDSPRYRVIKGDLKSMDGKFYKHSEIVEGVFDNEKEAVEFLRKCVVK